jgi:uncharacterized DUF497 family protein
MFDWDEENTNHIALHHVTRQEAEQAVTNAPSDGVEQFENGEERLMQIGVTNALRCLVVITTWRGALLRVVTAYQAPPALRDYYFRVKRRQ